MPTYLTAAIVAEQLAATPADHVLIIYYHNDMRDPFGLRADYLFPGQPVPDSVYTQPMHAPAFGRLPAAEL